jgi:tetratricopeptide (TPR) repeat protein
MAEATPMEESRRTWLRAIAFGLMGFVESVLAQVEHVTSTSRYSDTIRLHNQGVLFQEQGRFAEAETAFRQALRSWETLPDATSEEIAATLNGLGNLLRVEGHYLEAEGLLRRAISLEEMAGEPARLDLAFTLNSLGALYCNVREPRRAMPLLKRGLEIREQILGSNHPLVAASLDNLAEALIHQHRLDQAEALYRRSLSILEIHGDPSTLAMTRCKLGDLYFRRRRNLPEAETLYRQALPAWKQAPERDHPQIGLVLTGLAEVYIAQRRYPEAEPLLKQALEIQEKALGPDHPQVARVLLDYASLLHKQHSPREAAPLEKRAKKIMEAFNRKEPGLGTVDVSTLQRQR